MFVAVECGQDMNTLEENLFKNQNKYLSIIFLQCFFGSVNANLLRIQ